MMTARHGGGERDQTSYCDGTRERKPNLEFRWQLSTITIASLNFGDPA